MPAVPTIQTIGLRFTTPLCEFCAGMFSGKLRGFHGPWCPLDDPVCPQTEYFDYLYDTRCPEGLRETHHAALELVGLPCDKRCHPPTVYHPPTIMGESLIEKIKARWTVEEVAHRLTELRGTRVLTGPCPLHAERKGRSFTVWPDSQRWKCFGKCGIGGDVIDLVRAANERGLSWH